MHSPPGTAIPEVNRCFATTRWSLVLTAAQAVTPEAGAALAELCQTYWYPVYAHARRQGCDHHAAEDFTQEFFARLLKKNWLSTVARDKGRFRTFLLVAADHVLINEWRRGQAAKRGGGLVFLPLEESQLGEVRYAKEPAPTRLPGEEFDRRWATTMLETALERLRMEFELRGRRAQFDDWKVFLTREASTADCAESGRRLGMSTGAVTVAVHRMRERFGHLLRDVVSDTVANPDEVEDELRYLCALLGG